MSIDGPYDNDNIFAKILRGEMPCIKIFEDERVLAIMDVFPQAPGHVLVIPKEAVRNALEMSDEGLAAAMIQVKRLANAVRAALKPDGVILTQFNGSEAGQTVFHVHFHIIPRTAGQALGQHGGGMADMAELEAQATKIRAAL
jgi:histidine triad (HIT) family protein